MERQVASIYSMFMRFFPDEKSFWDDIAHDELDHASWLSNVNFLEMIDLLPSKDLLPTFEIIENSLKYVEQKSVELKSRVLNLEGALKLALRLEESMVEIFANQLIANVVSTNDESLSEKLLMAEKIHIDKIEDMMIQKGFLQLS